MITWNWIQIECEARLKLKLNQINSEAQVKDAGFRFLGRRVDPYNRQFLDDEGIDGIDWPSCSADVNPTEPLGRYGWMSLI